MKKLNGRRNKIYDIKSPCDTPNTRIPNQQRCLSIKMYSANSNQPTQHRARPSKEEDSRSVLLLLREMWPKKNKNKNKMKKIKRQSTPRHLLSWVIQNTFLPFCYSEERGFGSSFQYNDQLIQESKFYFFRTDQKTRKVRDIR